MKKRKHRLSLAVGILASLIGGGFSLLLVFGKNLIAALPEAAADLLGRVSAYAGIGSGELSLLPLGIFTAAGGILLLLFRRKKRFSMYLSIPFLVIIYLTVMLFSHMRDGNELPRILMSRLDPSRSWLVLVCAVLEVLLLLILLTVSGKVDKRLAEREGKRNKRIELQEERKKAEAEDAAAEAGNDVDTEEPVRSAEEEKTDKRYMKMKERMDRKTAKQEARLAAKDEKIFQK